MLKRATICCIAAMTMVGAYSASFASDTQWSAVADALGKAMKRTAVSLRHSDKQAKNAKLLETVI